MSIIRNRLKLEGEVPERCNECLPWGDEMRIAHRHEDGPVSEPTRPPEHCETCGYESLEIEVFYTRSGEAVRSDRGAVRKPAAPRSLSRRLKAVDVTVQLSVANRAVSNGSNGWQG